MTPLLAALLALGCAKSEAPVEAAVAEPEPAGRTRADMMHFHESRALAAMHDIVQGDLDSAREQFDWMALNAPPVDDIDPTATARLLALVAQPARDLSEASAIEGGLAAECGACHARVTGGPAPVTAITSAVAAGSGHMGAHQRAIELLWQGLVIPDEASWDAGQALLADTGPLRPDEDPAAYVHPHLDALGHRLAEVHEHHDRGAAFGAVLATCGGCHLGQGAVVW